MSRATAGVLLCAAVAAGLLADGAGAQQAAPLSERYVKREVRIPMRDGVHLFTSIYAPRDRSRPLPILMKRTPYSVSPYGADAFPGSLGPSPDTEADGYIFVFQDVRGAYMSEGEFVNMTPHRPAAGVTAADKQVDESRDTYDTIEWLLANVENHNGRVGMWGISYPGFYAAASMVDAHPALRAVSPQAPIADWFFDDFHHHGAFFLPHGFNFLASFGLPRSGPTTSRSGRFDHGTRDGYRFFLELGPLRNANEKHFHDRVAFWNDIVAHPNYDAFWQERNLLPHLAKVAPAVLTVGGWFDAEDLYGPLQIYRSVEARNPGIFNALVMGPWAHGGWARGAGERLGRAEFGAATSAWYRAEIERPFFRHFLHGEGEHGLAEATVFETGANRWRRFAAWPPAGVQERSLWMQADHGLSWSAPSADVLAHDAWISDPAKPVPFTEAVSTGMTREYMSDDQRFAARRPDVVVYRSEALEAPLTLAGPVLADLWVSTSGTASDWVVKLIDEFPPDAAEPDPAVAGWSRGGAQMMVRSEVLRGRFRNSYAFPEPFVPNAPTEVRVPMQDILHTFESGHRVVVQVQCTWFPLVDRNPHHYVDNVFLAAESDFVPATQRVFRGGVHRSRLVVGVLEQVTAK
ncbi:MAG TPA: CocE/NonD family hydrolase [Planctomycetota bacterium]